MHWINPGILPRFLNDQQTDGQNYMASYKGLMVQTDNSQTRIDPLFDEDLLTIELFAHRIMEITLNFKHIPAAPYK